MAQESVILNKEILERRKQNAKLMQLRYDSGTEDIGNLHLTQANQTDGERQFSSANRSLVLARSKLSGFLSFNIDKAEGDMAVKSPENIVIENEILNSPQLLILLKTMEWAEINKKKTISELLPSLSLSASLRKTGTDWPPDSSSNSISLSMSYPLFMGGNNIDDQFLGSVNYEKAKADYEKSKNDLNYSVKNAYNNYLDAIESYNSRKVYLDASKERVGIIKAKYLNGLVTYDEWDRAETDYINSQLSILSSKRSVLVSQAQFLNSYGGWIQ